MHLDMRTSSLIGAVLGLSFLLGGCAATPLAPISIGNYHAKAQGKDSHVAKLPAGALGCDAAVHWTLKDPVIGAIMVAGERYHTARASRTAPYGSGEFRIRDNVVEPAEVRASVRWRTPTPGVSAVFCRVVRCLGLACGRTARGRSSNGRARA